LAQETAKDQRVEDTADDAQQLGQARVRRAR